MKGINYLLIIAYLNAIVMIVNAGGSPNTAIYNQMFNPESFAFYGVNTYLDPVKGYFNLSGSAYDPSSITFIRPITFDSNSIAEFVANVYMGNCQNQIGEFEIFLTNSPNSMSDISLSQYISFKFQTSFDSMRQAVSSTAQLSTKSYGPNGIIDLPVPYPRCYSDSGCQLNFVLNKNPIGGLTLRLGDIQFLINANVSSLLFTDYFYFHIKVGKQNSCSAVALTSFTASYVCDSADSCPTPFVCSTDCNLNGICVGNEQCNCDSGYTGLACEFAPDAPLAECEYVYGDYDFPNNCAPYPCVGASLCQCPGNMNGSVGYCADVICDPDHGHPYEDRSCSCDGGYGGIYCNLPICIASIFNQVTYPQSMPGTIVTGLCPTGYTGTPSLNCDEFGVWSSSLAPDGTTIDPRCKPIDTPCHITAPYDPSLLNNTGLPFGTSIPDAFLLLSAATFNSSQYGAITCTYSNMTCPSYRKGHISFPETYVGQLVSGVCDAGFRGNPITYCNSDGSWLGIVQDTCNRITCPLIIDSVHNIIFPKSMPSIVFGECLGTVGGGEMTCNDDGTWSDFTGPGCSCF
jgi:hypothetical protein